MAKKVHIICAKCGSDDVKFEFSKTIEVYEGEESNTSIVCNDCGELTGCEEWNEHNGKADK